MTRRWVLSLRVHHRGNGKSGGLPSGGEGAGYLAYAYTTEESEKIEVQRRAESLGGDIELAIKQLAEK